MHRANKQMWLGGLILALGFSAVAPAGAQFATGDVFASVGNGLVRRYSAAGALMQTLNTTLGGFTTGSATDGAGNFYVTGFGANKVSKFDNNGTLVGSFTANGLPESILFNTAGNIYVSNVASGGVTKYSASGTLLNNYIAGTRVDWMDLAADQQTMFYTTEGTDIRRFDLATNTFLSNFAAGLGGRAFALRILGDGGVLLANGTNVLRLNSGGSVVQTYDIAGEDTWFALNLDPNGSSFWSGDYGDGLLYKFNIATGALEQTINTGAPGSLFGVSIYGEITQGGPPPLVTPEPASEILVATGLLGIVGVARKRRRA